MNVDEALARLKFQGVVGARLVGGVLVSCSLVPATITIPRGIVELKSYCCSGQDKLEQVYLINGVVRVGSGCFANCPNLVRIVCKEELRPYEDALKYGNHAKIEYRG